MTWFFSPYWISARIIFFSIFLSRVSHFRGKKRKIKFWVHCWLFNFLQMRRCSPQVHEHLFKEHHHFKITYLCNIHTFFWNGAQEKNCYIISIINLLIRYNHGHNNHIIFLPQIIHTQIFIFWKTSEDKVDSDSTTQKDTSTFSATKKGVQRTLFKKILNPFSKIYVKQCKIIVSLLSNLQSI